MYAVIRTGGKQYRVAEGDLIRVEKLEAEPGSTHNIGEVLMIGGEAPQIGTPLVAGASVATEIVEQARNKKVIIFKKRRRKHYRRKAGHRQPVTVLRVTGIQTA